MTRSKMKKGRRQSSVEWLVELLLTDHAISAEDMDAIRRWLVNGNGTDEKADVLVRKFTSNITYSRNPREACRLWPEFARRIAIGREHSREHGQPTDYFPEAGSQPC